MSVGFVCWNLSGVLRGFVGFLLSFKKAFVGFCLVS